MWKRCFPFNLPLTSQCDVTRDKVAVGVHKSFDIERIFCIKHNDIADHDFKISSFLGGAS